MTAVFREVVLTWDGVEYRVKPTMALLNQIEQRVSLASLVRGLASDAPAITHLAHVIGCFLRHGGAHVSDDDVYMAMLTGDQVAIASMRDDVIASIFPSPKKKGD